MSWRALAIFVVLIACGPAWGQTNGIFADFSTSKGDFTVWLDYSNAPRAVASFMGLATGEIGWADPQGNVWNKKFYDGSIFHRVVKDTNGLGIAIQGGGFASVSGTTTNFANAGYTMLESVTNGLLHSNGVISMANSGPNTDGSQFFITATNWPSWNGSYSVFGHVTTGMNVVTSIAAVAVQGQLERPVADVVLSNVVIRRVGAAATNFNIASQGVPIVESGPMRNYTSGSNEILEVEMASQSELMFRESTNLQSWESSDWGFYTNATGVLTGAVPRVALGDTYFFHASRIRYPTPITSPLDNRGRYFTFWWNTSPSVKYEVVFNANYLISGQYQVTTTNVVTGPVFVGDSWTRDPYSARLYFRDNLGTFGREYTYSLGFNPGQTTNRFTCTVRNWTSPSNYTSSSASGVFKVQ